MSVVASFTYVPDALIPPSQLVTFTDTSTGSPNKWLWDFGDGEQSNLQHPTHTFVGDVLDSFDVTLKAWLETSDATTSMGSILGTFNSTQKVQLGNVPPDQIGLFNASDSFVPFSANRYVSNMIDTNASTTWLEIRAARSQWSYTPTTNTLKVPVVRVPLVEGNSFYNRWPRCLQGTVYLKRSDPGTWPGNFGTVLTASAVGYGRNIEFDLSPWRGIPSWFMITSSEQALGPDYGDEQESGFMGYPVQTYDLNIASADDVDEDTQQLIFGAPPIADFTASPLVGANPLGVQFENLSTPAIGLPTTYSWKKRKSGSGDPYVEFSTDENPFHNFGK